MQELLVYEYAVIRVVPRVEREEFINVGVIVFCKKTGFIECAVSLNKEKLWHLCAEINMEGIEENLRAFCGIAAGDRQSGSGIALLDAASRFRWLTAARSTMIQCSRAHPGMTTTTENLTQQLLERLVL
ncbi:hypothetical protein A8C56_14600 [Niabella ginsenosidivorans]|uniref:DUF3037 domain-containing protein n=1 Tax=Niabella ginsenosidivorans TaxID=1176587 RepID=A0A1A9I341_9BACT|nr:DUF3037 domain-containing protein [Niabella ginsenosidivorans]ANH82036.1 hypothetical protein A8C56_14600 [Niabella ginsenosidivorans]